MRNLEGHRALQLRIHGPIDGPKSTGSQHLLNLVTAKLRRHGLGYSWSHRLRLTLYSDICAPRRLGAWGGCVGHDFHELVSRLPGGLQ